MQNGIQVQTIVVDSQVGMMPEHISSEYELDPLRVTETLVFYKAHTPEINANIRAEQELDGKHG